MSSKRKQAPRTGECDMRFLTNGSASSGRTSAKAIYLELAQAAGELLREPGWKVEVLSWVVGTRGVLDVKGIHGAMTFLETPASKRKETLRKSAAACARTWCMCTQSGNLERRKASEWLTRIGRDLKHGDA